MASTGAIIGILVIAVLAFIFLPKMMPQIAQAISGQAQATVNGKTITAGPGESVTMQNGIVQRNKGGSGNNISVQGKGACACANGVCKGDCSDMEPLDLENFDPLEWVEQHT